MEEREKQNEENLGKKKKKIKKSIEGKAGVKKAKGAKTKGARSMIIDKIKAKKAKGDKKND